MSSRNETYTIFGCGIDSHVEVTHDTKIPSLREARVLAEKYARTCSSETVQIYRDSFEIVATYARVEPGETPVQIKDPDLCDEEYQPTPSEALDLYNKAKDYIAQYERNNQCA